MKILNSSEFNKYMVVRSSDKTVYILIGAFESRLIPLLQGL